MHITHPITGSLPRLHFLSRVLIIWGLSLSRRALFMHSDIRSVVHYTFVVWYVAWVAFPPFWPFLALDELSSKCDGNFGSLSISSIRPPNMPSLLGLWYCHGSTKVQRSWLKVGKGRRIIRDPREAFSMHVLRNCISGLRPWRLVSGLTFLCQCNLCRGQIGL